VARELNPYEVGYLAGGPSRVAEVIIAEQLTSGALRVNSAGLLSKVGKRSKAGRRSKAAQPAKTRPLSGTLGRIALIEMPDELPANRMCSRLSSDPGITEIARDLRADKMFVSSSWMGALRVATLALPPVLLITGILRATEMAGYNGLVGAMITLMCVGIMIDLPLLVIVPQEPPLSSLGSTRLRHLRQVRESAPSPVVPEAMLLGVALDGFRAIPDEDIRKALLPESRARCSGTDSRGPAGCAMGHGCGSHGCGHGCMGSI
jgi:uncharacterized protein (TIGR04222 family)